MKEMTLGELKNRLPIGIADSEKQDFAFKFWGLEQEKHIADFKKSRKSHGDFVNKVLCYMLDHLGGRKFDEMSDAEKRVKLNQMSLMDILYMYIYLRFDQLDEIIVLNVGCPSCGKVNKNFAADMNGLDVKVVEKDDPATLTYELKKPFMLEEQEVKSIKIRRTPWDAMEKATDEITTNTGKMTELIFDHSIIGINDEEGFVDIQALLQRLHKRDIERLSTLVTKHNGGPSLVVNDNCKFCGSEFYQQLDWSYDSFFGASSLPQD